MAQYGDNLQKAPQMRAMVDQIWQFPFSWPPLLPDDLNAIDKDQILTSVKESLMDAQYIAQIIGEGGKIDINDLGSEFEPVAAGVQNSILQIFRNEIESHDDFRAKHQNFRFEELVNNIADWVDEDDKSRNGGSENQAYEQPRDTSIQLPPNRPFRTLSELHMVAGMTDEFYALLAPQITVYGTKGINPNMASDLVLKSLDPQITDEMVEKINERRFDPEKGGPFATSDDFFNFLDSLRIQTDKLRDIDFLFYFDAEYNFRIEASGRHLNVRKDITAVTYDIDNLTSRYLEMEEKFGPSPTPTPSVTPPPGSTPTPTPTPSTSSKYKVPIGRPNVVHWLEN
jgi:general secretion pathway protein K